MGGVGEIVQLGRVVGELVQLRILERWFNWMGGCLEVGSAGGGSWGDVSAGWKVSGDGLAGGILERSFSWMRVVGEMAALVKALDTHAW